MAHLLNYALNLTPNAGGNLGKSDDRIVFTNRTAGLPLITRDAQGRLVIEFVRRKASTDSDITSNVETDDVLAAFQPLDLCGATIT